MPSTFNGLDLFNSGPHRFTQHPLGEYVLTRARVDPFQAGSVAVGPLELAFTIRGRLVAETEEALWTLRDLIAAQLTDPPVTAVLKDTTEREYEDMAFVTFTPADRTDRGRVFSLAYTATFIRLAS